MSVLKIENNKSQWDFWDLLRTTARTIAEDMNFDTCTNPIEFAERMLIKFLIKIPSGDYSNIYKEWEERD